MIEIIEKKNIDNKVEVKNKNLERRNSDYSEISIIPQNKNAYYDKDSDICSVNSNLINDSKFDIKSEKSHSNPPKHKKDNKSQNLFIDAEDKENNEKNKNKTYHNDNVSNKIKDNLAYNNPSSTSKALKSNKKSSKDDDDDEENKNLNYQYGAVGEFFQKKFNFMNKAKITKELFEKTDELLSLEEFKDKYNTFPYIYLADLKKHHLIYFTFIACNDNNNIFLKLSYFSLTINFYFGLNTMLIFDSNMSDAYYDKEKAKPVYIFMNLILPFIICGLISFVIKILIMPSYCINKIIRKIQDNENLQKLVNNKENIVPQLVEVENNNKKKGNRGRSIKNVPKSNKINQPQNIYSKEYLNEKDKLDKELSSIYQYYIKKVMIYFIASFIILTLNWYMMTSFCAIFKNTGTKLIVNSSISLLASFILPFILGLIPSVLGLLAIKTKSEVIYRIYKFINIII